VPLLVCGLLPLAESQHHDEQEDQEKGKDEGENPQPIARDIGYGTVRWCLPWRWRRRYIKDGRIGTRNHKVRGTTNVNGSDDAPSQQV